MELTNSAEKRLGGNDEAGRREGGQEANKTIKEIKIFEALYFVWFICVSFVVQLLFH